MNIFNLELSKALFLLFLGIAVNIFLGVILAENFKEGFNKEVFKRGVIKGMAVIVGVTSIAIAANFDSSIMFNDVPILDYVMLTIKATYFYYYGQVVIKTFGFVKIPSEENVIDTEIDKEEYIKGE